MMGLAFFGQKFCKILKVYFWKRFRICILVTLTRLENSQTFGTFQPKLTIFFLPGQVSGREFSQEIYIFFLLKKTWLRLFCIFNVRKRRLNFTRKDPQKFRWKMAPREIHHFDLFGN